MNEKENKMDELLTAAQRQLALRDELLQRQRLLACEVSCADVGAPRRYSAVLKVAATLLLLVVPSALVAACAKVPDECSMRTGCERATVLTDVNQILETL